MSDAFIAELSPAAVVLRDARATHNGLLKSESTVRSVTDSLRTWLHCSDGNSDGRRVENGF